MESQGRDIKMDEKRVEGYRNFATKLWNAARFCQSNGIGASQSLTAPAATSAVNKWIIGEVVETLQRITKTQTPAILKRWLDALDSTGRWALLKLLTGALRVGVSARLAKQAAANIGNHEFNYGLPFLRQALSGAQFPYVSANVMLAAEPTRHAFTPYVLLERQLTVAPSLSMQRIAELRRASGDVMDGAHAEALAAHIASFWPATVAGAQGQRFAVLTGGEPLLQVDAALIDALHAQGFEIAVETNGSVAAPAGLDWICVSPKAGAPLVQRSGHELKVVVPQAGFTEADLLTFEQLDFRQWRVQAMDSADPQARRQAMAWAVQWCLDHPRWLLSVQTHKSLGIR